MPKGKSLILMRHGLALDVDTGLTKQGIASLYNLAAQTIKICPTLDGIVHTSCLRTKETALIMGSELSTHDGQVPEMVETDTVKSEIRPSALKEEWDSACVVSHMGIVANAVHEIIQDVPESYKTQMGSLVFIHAETDSWDDVFKPETKKTYHLLNCDFAAAIGITVPAEKVESVLGDISNKLDTRVPSTYNKSLPVL